MRGQKILFSSQSDEWETPHSLFEGLDREFCFTFDVCATKQNTKCKNYYSLPERDGLVLPWTYVMNWCNPPYSQISEWARKAFMEQCNGRKSVMLLPSRTDTTWFHNYIYKRFNVEIRFLRGRLKFSNSKNSAPFPSMVVIFR